MTATTIEWASNLDDALARAAAGRRFVLADFTRRRCAGCEALQAVTYPDPDVSAFIQEHLVPVHVHLEERSDQPHFQAQRVIWTPTLVVMDRRGVGHYQSPGFLPPPLFLSMLRIGLARALLARARYAEAAGHLERVAEEAANPLAAEALFWLGTAYYLPGRRRSDLMRAWGRLLDEHPGSVWAARVPPGQEEEIGPET